MISPTINSNFTGDRSLSSDSSSAMQWSNQSQADRFDNILLEKQNLADKKLKNNSSKRRYSEYQLRSPPTEEQPESLIKDDSNSTL